MSQDTLQIEWYRVSKRTNLVYFSTKQNKIKAKTKEKKFFLQHLNVAIVIVMPSENSSYHIEWNWNCVPNSAPPVWCMKYNWHIHGHDRIVWNFIICFFCRLINEQLYSNNKKHMRETSVFTPSGVGGCAAGVNVMWYKICSNVQWTIWLNSSSEPVKMDPILLENA